jgi:hypothetical protein
VGNSGRHRTSPRNRMRAVHHHSAVLADSPRTQLPTSPATERSSDRNVSNPSTVVNHSRPRPLFRRPPPGGRRHDRK